MHLYKVRSGRYGYDIIKSVGCHTEPYAVALFEDHGKHYADKKSRYELRYSKAHSGLTEPERYVSDREKQCCQNYRNIYTETPFLFRPFRRGQFIKYDKRQ